MTFFKYCLLAICLSSGLVSNMANTLPQLRQNSDSGIKFEFINDKGLFSADTIQTKMSSSSDNFNWLLQWMSKNEQKFTSVPADHYCNNTVVLNYQPNSNKKKFKYNGHGMYVKIDNCYSLSSASNSQASTEIIFNIVGVNKDVTKMIKEAKMYAMNMKAKFQSSQNVSFYKTLQAPVENLMISPVTLDNDVFKTILQDIHHTKNLQSWYNKKETPYYRGYLLVGPPGCGKTSTMSLAEEINHNYYMYDLNNLNISANQIFNSTKVMPPKSVLLIKNIDAMPTNNKKNKHNDSQTVDRTALTFKDVVKLMIQLNTLDGMFMLLSTTHIDELDSDLKRAGGIDFKQYVEPCSNYQYSQFVIKFYSEATKN